MLTGEEMQVMTAPCMHDKLCTRSFSLNCNDWIEYGRWWRDKHSQRIYRIKLILFVCFFETVSFHPRSMIKLKHRLTRQWWNIFSSNRISSYVLSSVNRHSFFSHHALMKTFEQKSNFISMLALSTRTKDIWAEVVDVDHVKLNQ